MPASFKTIAPTTLTNGVPTRLSSSSRFASSVVLFSDPLNTGNIYYGDSAVTTTRGIPIAPGVSQPIAYDMVYGTNGKLDLSTIYLDTDTSGNSVRVVYIQWDGF